MADTKTVAKWSAAVASSLVLSVALSRAEYDAGGLALVVGGLACSPLLSQVSVASRGLSAGAAGQPIIETVAMLLIALAVSAAYGAAADTPPPKWDIGVLAVVAAGLTSGVLAGLNMAVTSEILFGVVLLPVVHLGLWLGVAARRKDEPEIDGCSPGRLALDAGLGLVLAMCALWLTQINVKGDPSAAAGSSYDAAGTAAGSITTSSTGSWA